MFEFISDLLYDLARQLRYECHKNMYEVRFPNIYILSRIIYYIFPLTLIIILAIKAIGFSKVKQTLSNMFAMHYGDIKD